MIIEDMDGGTFTISNGGVFGCMFGTPIINPPQSAILGMHGIFDRPIPTPGTIAKDHRTFNLVCYNCRF
jgi:2-oxoglutarate dehydrogenase E2 component (dihydrolipoamide succinyltransferase)